ncbi:MAG: hypothetical protein LKI39_12505 [Bacteroides sp.]|nr:hypothetical protein [Bacteroides sp.]MCI1683360.1 hypothetical protein [Bacteroides sp.]
MKEQNSILEKVGKENAFQVPSGYFENFTSEVMKNLPAKETQLLEPRVPTRWEKVRPWVYMTAMFIGAALIIRVASTDRVTNSVATKGNDTEAVSDEYISTALDNSMMDDYSLYIYLTDANPGME